MYISIGLALLVGLSWSINGWIVRKFCKKDNDCLNVSKINIDAGFIIGLIFLCFYIYYRQQFSLVNIGLGLCTSFFYLAGSITLGKAFLSGKGGLVQSIISAEIFVSLLLSILILQIWPTNLQYLGMGLVFVGAISVSLLPDVKQNQDK